MKRKYIIGCFVLALIAGFSTTGCKNYLEKPQGGAVTSDTIFHTKIQAQYAVAQMYYLSVRSYFPNYSEACRPEAITDQLYILSPSYDWAQNRINGGLYNRGNMSPDKSCDYGFGQDGAGNSYGAHYKGIRQANLVLKNIDRVIDGDDNWKRDIKGQALFCRAMQHYEAFRYYGGIPIVTEPLEGDNLKVPRSTVAAVVDSIVTWCDQAYNLLPTGTRNSTEYGMITRLAALSLKSRVLLYAASPLYNTPDNMKTVVSEVRFGDERDAYLCYPNYDKNRWKRAADAAKAVLDYAPTVGCVLFDKDQPTGVGANDTYATIGDYESVYNVYANQELILVNTRNQVPRSGGGWDDQSAWGQYMSSKLRLAQWGVKNNVPVEFIQQYEKRDGTKWTLPASGADLPVDIVALNLDPRFYQTVAYDGMRYNATRGNLAYYKKGDYATDGNLASSDAGVDGYALEVFKFVGRIDNMSDNHFAWPVFRLAEFYLNYAEALNEFQGPAGDATQYLNAIRQRAGMPDKNIANADDFREAVQNERSIELAYEGHRYNDLNRWLKAHVILNGTLHGVATTARNVGGQLKRTWTQVNFIQRVYPKKYYYVPFPSSETSKQYLGNSSGWTGQNPGW